MGLLLAAVLGGFFGFNAIATPDKVAQIMKDALQKRYPAAQVVTKVEGKRGKDVLKGRFHSVRIEMSNLGAIDGVPLEQGDGGKAKKRGTVGHFELLLQNFTFDKTPVESADLTMDDVVYDLDALKDKKQLRLVDSGPGVAHLTVAADALESLLAEKYPDLKEIDLTMKNGEVRVSGKKIIPLVHVAVPFHLSARLEIHNTNELWVTDEHVAFEQVTGFSLNISKLFERLNPVYTFDKDKKWPFTVEVTKLLMDEDKLNATATLKFAEPPTPPAQPPTPPAQ